MGKRQLTQAKADALRPGENRIVWDGGGLGARISAASVVWIVDYVDGATGRRTRRVIGDVHGRDRMLLAEARAEAARRRAGGEAEPARTGSITLRKAWEQLIETGRMSLSPATVASYEQRIGHPLKELGDKLGGKITEDDVRRCIFQKNSERERTYTHTLIRMTINWAIRNKHIPASHHNPASAIKKREMLDKNKLTLVREISRRDLSAFGKKLAEWEAAGKASPWLAGLMRLSLLCALRPSEARTVRLEYVDLRQGVMTVRGKTGARRVWLSPEARSVLETLPRIDGVEWVFPGRKFGEPIVAAHKQLHALQDEANVPRFRPYDLRHTAATSALVGGADVRAVQDLLGHGDLSTTQKYLHASDERRKAASALAGRKGAVILPLKKGVADPKKV